MLRIDWISAIFFGVFVFILVFTSLNSLAGLFSSLGQRRDRFSSLLPGNKTAQAKKAVKVAQDDLLGLGKIPWVQLYILGGCLGLGLYLLTHQMLAAFLALVPFGVRAWLTSQRKRELNSEILAFLTDLRLAIPLHGSLLRALQEVAGSGSTRLSGIVARYLKGGWNGSGLQLLEALAADTKIDSLSDLVAWTRAAEEGVLAADKPFEHALERLQAETHTAALENMQRIPTRLTVLVLPALLGPAIVLMLYPVAARLLANMGGMGWSGGY